MFSRKLLVNLYHSGGLLLHTPLYQEPQPTAQPPSPSHYQDSSFRGGFDANLIMILSVLLCALICSLCINSVIRCVFKCSSLLAREPNYYISTIRPGASRVDGVDKKALRSFPIVKYSKEVNVQGLDTECVICLSEFKEGEKLRILPKCNHGFHVKCIDKWLKSHSSCPTCRRSLVDTCQKIVGCHDDHQDTSSPSSSSSSLPERVIGEVIALNIVPLEREDLVRNYRGQIVT